MSDDFIEEIKEDVRNDQLLAFWRDYGNIIVGTLIAIILATIAYLFWHNAQEKKLLKQTLAYESNLDLKGAKSAQPDYTSLIKEGSNGYKIMGVFEQARSVSSAEKAAFLLKSVAENTSLNPFYRDIASLQTIMRKFDSTNGSVLLEELDPLVSRVSPVQAAALELQGFAYFKLQNNQKAVEAFRSVFSHPQATSSMKNRARAMLEILK